MISRNFCGSQAIGDAAGRFISHEYGIGWIGFPITITHVPASLQLKHACAWINLQMPAAGLP
jgi:hypothetical protein